MSKLSTNTGTVKHRGLERCQGISRGVPSIAFSADVGFLVVHGQGPPSTKEDPERARYHVEMRKT